MTATELYTSLKSLYKSMMFPVKQGARKWTPTEIDQLDVHFLHSLLDDDEPAQEQEQYLSDMW